MRNASIDEEEARLMASDLVAQAQARLGSKMLAYDTVARDVGTSPSWLRKFIGGYADGEPSFSIGMNIVRAYEKVCERVEEANNERRARISALKGKNNAATEGGVRRLGFVGPREVA